MNPGYYDDWIFTDVGEAGKFAGKASTAASLPTDAGTGGGGPRRLTRYGMK